EHYDKILNRHYVIMFRHVGFWENFMISSINQTGTLLIEGNLRRNRARMRDASEISRDLTRLDFGRLGKEIVVHGRLGADPASTAKFICEAIFARDNLLSIISQLPRVNPDDRHDVSTAPFIDGEPPFIFVEGEVDATNGCYNGRFVERNGNWESHAIIAKLNP
ncbi:MAG: hypothetical protein ABL962_13900, partial [Fimbriimonadaceae bacterium]